MKKVLIIGASGSLAQYVTDAVGKLHDIQLTLFLRNKSRLLNNRSDGHKVIEGDAMNIDDLRRAIEGQDIVYVNLAGNLDTMTQNIVKVMQEYGVRRIIAISSIGIYDSPMKSVLVPYRKLADIIEASGLDYTILRPDWFTNENEIEFTLTKKGNPEIGTAISRKSIAAFVASIMNDPETYKNENLGISKPR